MRRALKPRQELFGLSPLVVALLAVGLALRLTWVAAHPVEPVSDFNEYNKHAANLAQHGLYTDNPAYQDAYWPPGWPALLAVLYLVIGVHPLAGGLLGATLEWGAIVVAAVAASRLLRPAFAAGAVGAMCVYPGGVAFGPVLGTEHLAALLFTSAVVLMGFARPSLRTALVAGLLVGALILVRADIGLPTALVIGVWLLRGAPLRRSAALAAVAATSALVFIGPWIVRNAVQFGEFIPTSTNGGVNFYLGTVAPEYTEPPLFKRRGSTDTVHPKADENWYYHEGAGNVADDPLRWLGFDVRRVYYLYGQESLLLWWGEIEDPTAQDVASAYWLVIVAFALVGLGVIAVDRRRLPRAWSFIAGSILLVSVLKLAFVLEPRHRLTLTYLLVLVAGLGAQQLLDGYGRLRRAPR